MKKETTVDNKFIFLLEENYKILNQVKAIFKSARNSAFA